MQRTTDGGAPLPAANEARLSSLLNEAKSADSDLSGAPSAPRPGEAVPGEPPEPEALPLDRELAGMFAMLGVGLGKFLPSVASVLNEQACNELGGVLAPVAEKYGIAHYITGFAWRVELQALIVAGPIVFGTIAAVRQDIEALKAAKASIAGNSDAAASSEAATVTVRPDTPGKLKPIDLP